ncbi:ureidoglycolate lyase [Arenimonas sp.]|uniref:ureidoglycolate lyase n=1 Tax=Arenimonas sp. TaxID=1872635 RepID=UPI0039E6CC8D
MPRLVIEPLDREAFAPFGDVLEPGNAETVYEINAGTAQRFHALARVDIAGDDGAAVISLFRAQPRALPFVVSQLERHPLGSQAFMPLGTAPYLVVVAESPQSPPRAFFARAGQGVNFRRGTWHHPLLALERESDFLVVDRSGTAPNCDEIDLPEPWTIEPLSPR